MSSESHCLYRLDLRYDFEYLLAAFTKHSENLKLAVKCFLRGYSPIKHPPNRYNKCFLTPLRLRLIFAQYSALDKMLAKKHLNQNLRQYAWCIRVRRRNHINRSMAVTVARARERHGGTDAAKRFDAWYGLDKAHYKTTGFCFILDC